MPESKPSMMRVCTYCSAPISADAITVDHVLARSWYPDNTPPVKKWQVDACQNCNSSYSRIEEDVLVRLSFCLDPNEKTVSKIVDSARRSIDPSYGRNAEDAARRLNRKLRLQRELLPIAMPNQVGMLPAFKSNFDKGSRHGIVIPRDDLEKIVAKWMRGIHLCEVGRLVPVDAEVKTYFVSDDVAKEAFGDIEAHAKIIQKGPGVEVSIWDKVEGVRSITLYAFKIWREFRAYGSIDQSS